MGTRSLTIVKDQGEVVLNMYRQMDGYPTGHGQELADFLKPFQVVNGIGMTPEGKKLANGLGCLAGQIVAHFKESVGGFYLYPTKAKNVGEEFTYIVYGNESDQLTLEVHTSNGNRRKLLWKGKPKDYNGAEIEKGEN